jgi:hypothetical protein
MQCAGLQQCYEGRRGQLGRCIVTRRCLLLSESLLTCLLTLLQLLTDCVHATCLSAVLSATVHWTTLVSVTACAGGMSSNHGMYC